MKTDPITSMSWEVLSASIEEALTREQYHQAEELALSALEEAEEFEPGDRRFYLSP